MTLEAGIDSSTQACKVVVRDAETGALLRVGRAAHPDGTEVSPHAWWSALQEAVEQAGGIHDVGAVSVGGQQHGMVCLDSGGEIVRPALLWNDTRSAAAAAELVDELGGGEAGARAWAEAVGSVPAASFTVTKLRWLAEHEPDNAERTAAVCLPHDWLTWRLTGGSDLGALFTDRDDASGTGYWSAATGQYRMDLLRRALGREAAVPLVLGPSERAGQTPSGSVLGPGTGDNAAAALGVGAGPGDVVVSIGTSGVVSAVADVPAADCSGTVARLRRRHRQVPSTGLHAERGSGPGRGGAAARRRPRRVLPTGAGGAGGRGRAGRRPVPRGRAHPQPAAGDGAR